MDKAIVAILYTLLILGCCLISWSITAGLVWLVCLCFDLTFKWVWATGIWIILIALKLAL